ncbi:MAG: Dethiobiotin synthase BioD [Nitrospira sp.]|nr:MAG: Dethiobiotin synthase BioD [Nitrospira sp.]
MTGTDTGVGKTVVSAALVRRLVQAGCSVGVMKPVETGVRAGAQDAGDAGRLMAAAGVEDTLDLVSPYRFHAPLAPFAAACEEERSIDRERILRRYERLTSRYACVVVEGAGGLLVPMGSDWSMRDLIGRLQLPVVLVGRAGLGGINHALLTLESLERAGIGTLALVLNETRPASTSYEQEQVASTVALLRERAGVPVLGPLPYQAGLDHGWCAAIETLARSRPIKDLADRLLREIVGNSESPLLGQEP